MFRFSWCCVGVTVCNLIACIPFHYLYVGRGGGGYDRDGTGYGQGTPSGPIGTNCLRVQGKWTTANSDYESRCSA